MAVQWYYSRDTTKSGPCTERQLKDLAASGQILPTDTIWKAGIEKGVLASKVKNLFLHTEPASASAWTGVREAEVPTKPVPTVSLPAYQTASELQAILLSSDAQPVLLDESTPSVDGTSAGSPETSMANGAPESLPPKAPATMDAPGTTQRKATKGRAVGVKGVVILGQDGEMVRFKKTCIRCGFVDNCSNKLPIKSGVIRANFFCPKCRKAGEVVIQCLRQ